MAIKTRAAISGSWDVTSFYHSSLAGKERYLLPFCLFYLSYRLGVLLMRRMQPLG